MVSLSSRVWLGPDFVTPRAACRPAQLISHYPGDATPCRVEHANRFRLFPFRSPLLRKSRLFSLPPGTEMFQFPRFAPQGLCIQPRGDQALPRPGCPIRKSPDLRLFAPPRGLSQLTTSFIAFRCQGIHHMPLIAWPKASRPYAGLIERLWHSGTPFHRCCTCVRAYLLSTELTTCQRTKRHQMEEHILRGACRHRQMEGSVTIPAHNRPDTGSEPEPTCLETELVEIAGLEPATSGLQSRRSPS